MDENKLVTEKKILYCRPIRILFTQSELDKQDEFKQQSGMTYNSLTDRAIAFYIDNRIFENSPEESEPKKEKKTFRERWISEIVYQKLLGFCNSQNRATISNVTAQAVSHFIVFQR